MSEHITPMMAQYLALKAQAGDSLLFYRMGDFFELFFEDARQAARILDIALTTRGEHAGQPVPMCGVPVHTAEAYLARLIRAGCQVAIAEQTETPEAARQRGGKAMITRSIVRLVTAGTLTEEALLEPRTANLLLSVCGVRGVAGIASVDISTGRMELEECPIAHIGAALARLDARESVAPEGWEHAPDGATARPVRDFTSEGGASRLMALHHVATLDGFGPFSRAMLAAAAGLLAYLEHVGRGAMPLLLPPRIRAEAAHLVMDEATRASLEILTSAGGGRQGSLIHTIDRCVTGAGARLLAEDLSAPLADMGGIAARLAMVAWLYDAPLLREDVRGHLRTLPDIGRALGRIVAGRGTPRDLGQVRDGLAGAAALAERLAPTLAQQEHVPDMLRALHPHLGGHRALVAQLSRALIPAPPTERAQGGFIAEQYDTNLDELRHIAKDARTAIAALEAQYREDTGVTTLKIRHNGVLGYFIEVAAARAEPLMAPDSGFTHRQTTAGAMRFNALALHEAAGRITTAGSQALAIEEAHFADLVTSVAAASQAIATTAEALARLDVSAGQAERAAEGQWCRPELTHTPELIITGGRHPVVEAALQAGGLSGSARFVANDCQLVAADRLWLIGGPNMGGKSTFLRQNALIILMAQAGGFVPAGSARIGLVDRVFSRVGAADNLARGRSTFMVEMVETAAILAAATPRSFVILDEVGRGTSTYDGLALASAVAEAVHGVNRCRCLFATHYHELAKLAESCAALSLHHMRAREWKGELVLLHEVAPGPAESSYGLAVARLAGVPASVIARAKAVLEQLEKSRTHTGGWAGMADLPLFAAVEAGAETGAETGAKGPEMAPDPLRVRLTGLDIDALTPRAALELLYELRAECDGMRGAEGAFSPFVQDCCIYIAAPDSRQPPVPDNQESQHDPEHA